MTPFRLVFVVELKYPQLTSIGKIFEQEYAQWYDEQWEELPQVAKKQILKVQIKQQNSFNKNKKEA